MAARELCRIIGHEWKFERNVWRLAVRIECVFCNVRYSYEFLNNGTEQVTEIDHRYLDTYMVSWTPVSEVTGQMRLDVESFLPTAREEFLKFWPLRKLTDPQRAVVREWKGVSIGSV